MLTSGTLLDTSRAGVLIIDRVVLDEGEEQSASLSKRGVKATPTPTAPALTEVIAVQASSPLNSDIIVAGCNAPAKREFVGGNVSAPWRTSAPPRIAAANPAPTSAA